VRAANSGSRQKRPERGGTVANLLKFLVLFVGGVAILHKLQPLLGIELL
jgi:hypothetical protein